MHELSRRALGNGTSSKVQRRAAALRAISHKIMIVSNLVKLMEIRIILLLLLLIAYYHILISCSRSY